MTIEEMVASLQAIIDGAEGRDLTDAEIASYAELEGKLNSARRSDDIRKRQAAYTTPLHSGIAVKAACEPDVRSSAFDRYIRSGQVADGLLTSAQSEGTASAGGYLVPDEFSAQIVKRIVDFGGFAAAARTINTAGGNPLTIAVTIDDTANTGAIVNEGGAFVSGADITFGTVSLGAYTYASNGTSTDPVKVSWELLDDSDFDVPGLLADLLGERIGRIQSTHWISGDGAMEPQGILTPKTAYANIASATTPFVTYAELVNTVHALDSGYRANAKWLMSDASLGLIRTLVDGNSRPLWLPQNESGMGPMPGGTLLGYPVIIDNAMPDLAASGAAKSIGFGDWNKAYTIRRVREVGIVRLNELYAATRQTGFFSWARADGCVVDSNAYVILANKA